MKQTRWQFAGVVLALVALFLRSAPAAKSSARIAGAAAPTAAAQAAAGAAQLTISSVEGGTASITGFQLPGPMLTAQATGVGHFTFGGAGAPPSTDTAVVIKANIDITQVPPAIRNGTLTITAPSGAQVTANFQGQASVPDSAGFSDVSATYTITGGTGQWTGVQGSGTVTGTLNFTHSAFTLTSTGAYVPPPAMTP